ncbi:MAG: glycerol-3-phosphate dehydrogenase [Clostridia bacterium]
MNITVIGPGRWGSFIAWYLSEINHSVTLYGRKNSDNFKKISQLDNKFSLTSSLSSIKESDIIVISVNSQGFRGLMTEIKTLDLKDKYFVLCMKGIEIESDKRLSEIASEYLDNSCSVSVWLGPGHVQEFQSGIPNCMVIDSENEESKKFLVSEFSSNLIRFYYGNDLIGNEIGAAAKNVIGIAAGMLDGLKLSTLKGALMSRGTREIARLIKMLGGNENSAYGLCHLGDYEATVFSKYSHNRMFGEKVVLGETYTDLAEGYFTVKALVEIGKKLSVDLPICNAVYKVLYENSSVQDTIFTLFSRSIKEEFYE